VTKVNEQQLQALSMASSSSRNLPDWMRSEDDVAEEQRMQRELREASRQALAAQPFSEPAQKRFWRFLDPKDGVSSALAGDGTGPAGRVRSPAAFDRVVCFDVEATGGGAEDVVVEVGAVEVVGGVRTGRLFQSYAALPRGDDADGSGIGSVQMQPWAWACHRIDEKLLECAPPLSVVLRNFADFLWGGDQKTLLVAHNAAYDTRILLHSIDRCRTITLPEDQPVLCTQQAFRESWRRRNGGNLAQTSMSLETVSQKLGIDLLGRTFHGALPDAELVAAVFCAMRSQEAARRGDAHSNGGKRPAPDSTRDGSPPHKRANETQTESSGAVHESSVDGSASDSTRDNQVNETQTESPTAFWGTADP
jgi:DNA polymerase III epsilon subunit-like protein